MHLWAQPGALVDRIDIHPLRFASGIFDIDVPRVEYDKLAGDRLGEPSSQLRERVEGARAKQRERFGGTTLQCNGDMGPAEVRKYCGIDDTGRSLLRAAMQQMSKIPRFARGD